MLISIFYIIYIKIVLYFNKKLFSILFKIIFNHKTVFFFVRFELNLINII